MFYTIGCIFLYKFAKTELTLDLSCGNPPSFNNASWETEVKFFYLEIKKEMIYNTYKGIYIFKVYILFCHMPQT